MSRTLLALLLTFTACGPAAFDPDAGSGNPGGPGKPSCDGSGPAVPADFPQLGTQCGSHFTWRWTNELFSTHGEVDEADPRGVRRIEDAPYTGTYDLGTQSTSRATDSFHPVVLFLPSLSPGVYRAGDGVGLAHVLTSVQTSGTTNGKTGALVEIVGATAEAVWGRFLGRTCAVDYEKNCYHFEAGRFAAARDTAASDFEFGYPISKGSDREVCETRSDCPQHNAIPPLCTAGLCSGQPSPGP